MKYRKVIFIDPATTLGWASVDRDKASDPKFYSSGVVTLYNNSPGERAYDFWKFLGQIMLDKNGKRAYEIFLAWEESAFSWRGAAQSRMYGTWEGLLLLFCEMHKIPCTTVNGSTIKAYAKKHGFYNRRPPKPYRRPGEIVIRFKERLDKWRLDGLDHEYDAKPRPRPEWKLSAISDLGQMNSKFNDNEVDARWGLEYVLKQLEK